MYSRSFVKIYLKIIKKALRKTMQSSLACKNERVAMTLIMLAVMKNLGCLPNNVKAIHTYERGYNSQKTQDHRDINKNRDDDTKYASNFSNFATRYFSHSLWLNDKNFSKTPLSTAVTPNMINNNKEFANLDRNLGANRPLHNDEKQWIDKNVDNFKEFYKDQTGISLNNLQAKKLLDHSAKFYSGRR
ncbi:hypothetical protein B9N61_09470 [Campylobacter concisus]|uniref:Uncharacterized protein n=3 Tax=Campylobacter concisus TaxID=199 RepID=A0A1Y5NE97_9BACT|nr:hypothetical protein B9N61_09470 [Campylobacter concisus]